MSQKKKTKQHIIIHTLVSLQIYNNKTFGNLNKVVLPPSWPSNIGSRENKIKGKFDE